MGGGELWGIHMTITQMMVDFSAVLVEKVTGIKRTGKQARRSTLQKGRDIF